MLVELDATMLGLHKPLLYMRIGRYRKMLPKQTNKNNKQAKQTHLSVRCLSISAMLMCWLSDLYSLVSLGIFFTKSWISVIDASLLSRNLVYLKRSQPMQCKVT
jgi:hypothetical protein